MSCIIKKHIFINDTETKAVIIFNEDYFPFKVSEDPNDLNEMKEYILDTWGPGKYYVYAMGGTFGFRKYFNGLISLSDV